jgi:transcription initiation factor IIF auxiliary subunit
MSLETRQKTRYKGNDWWQWSVWIEGQKAELDAIQSVTYTLHPTFPNRVRRIENRATKFRLDSSGWGGFQIRIFLQFKDGEKRRMAHELELFYPQQKSNPTSTRASKKAPQISSVFVSSSVADSAVASIIKNALQKKRINLKDLSTVELEIPYELSVQKAIRTSDALVAVRSDARNSRVETEIAYAKDAGIPIITIDTESRKVHVEEPRATAVAAAKASSGLGKLSVSLGKSLKSSSPFWS